MTPSPRGPRDAGWRAALRLVVALYPEEFRRSLGEDMCAVFAVELRRRRRTGGGVTAVGYGVATLSTAVAGALRERIHGWMSRRRTGTEAGGARVPETGGTPGTQGNRGGRRTMMIQDFRQDLKLLLRQIKRRPGLAVIVELTLALGIGMNTGVFSVVRSVLLRPLPFRDAQELVYFTGGGASSLPNLNDLEDGLHSMRSMAGVFVPTPMTLTGVGDPAELRVSIVTPGFFGLTGLDPALGRWLGQDDDGTRRAVLSHHLWMTRFGGDAGVVGRAVTLDEDPVEIVGVAPSVLGSPFDADVWMSNPWASGTGPRASRAWRAAEVYGRLAPGWTLTSAREELSSVWSRLQEQYPDANGRWRVELRGLKDYLTRDESEPLEILFLASGLFLLLACANVASILLSRLDTRRHEFAVRSSLGAGRWRLLRQAWTEAFAMSFLGGGIGVAVAFLGVAWAVSHLGLSLFRLDQITVDPLVLGFALLATLVAGCLVGAVTLLAWGEEEPAQALRSTGGAIVRRTGLLRRALVVGEVAMAFVIVTGLGLLLRSFQKVQAVDTGVRAENIVTASVGSLPTSRYPDADARRTFGGRLRERLDAVGGVEGVALASRRPLAGCCSNGPFHRSDDSSREARFVETRQVTDSYFRVLGIPILAGRDLTGVQQGGEHVAVIDDVLRQQLFGDEDPVGATIEGMGEVIRVVGVAGAVREYGVERRPPPLVYVSDQQYPIWSPHVIVRGGLGVDRTAEALRGVLHEIDPLLPLENVEPLGDVVASYTVGQRATTSLMLLMGGLALLLGGVGIYGVMSHTVQERLRESGLRLVLGAERRDILRGILRNALMLTLPGVALGLAAAVAARKVITSLLYETSPMDPAVYAAVLAVFLTVPLLAAWVPARRAARVEVAAMLRETAL